MLRGPRKSSRRRCTICSKKVKISCRPLNTFITMVHYVFQPCQGHKTPRLQRGLTTVLSIECSPIERSRSHSGHPVTRMLLDPVTGDQINKPITTLQIKYIAILRPIISQSITTAGKCHETTIHSRPTQNPNYSQPCPDHSSVAVPNKNRNPTTSILSN